MLPTSWALGATTATFQNGVNGYSGTFDRRIEQRTGDNELDGSTVPQYFLDGFAPPENPGEDPASPDAQGLIRFDDIIGNGPGQIPSGAFILDAQLQLRTSPAGNAQTSGPYGVAGLLQPFDSSTSYNDFTSSDPLLSSRGAWWQDGYSTRPVGGYGPQVRAGVDSANVRSLVQAWSDGTLDNNGVAVQAGFPGTTDGWSIQSTGHPFPEGRPKLSVTYTTEPVEVNTFQRGLNGYEGDTMARVISGDILLGSDPASDDETTSGLDLGQAFLDGLQFSDTQGAVSSQDQLALVKFNNVFGAGEGQAPTDVPVAKAWLVLTTGDESGSAGSDGFYSAHAMRRDWDTTSLYSNFGDLPGLQVADGDIGAALDTKAGLVHGSEVWFDVTSYVEGVRNGADDFGLAVQSAGTSDGWQIHFNGSGEEAARPRLIVASSMDAGSAALPGDFNGDGTVDAADYTVWRDNYGGTFNLNNNGDESGASAGVVDDADYFWWVDNFGNTLGSGSLSPAAVPEPSTWALGLLVAGVFAAYRARKS